ncbi:MAG: adenylate/guanylate cyclase domain-containing protein [Geminicoccaceae bacterium]
MPDSAISAIVSWTTSQGLAGTNELDLLTGFCERMQDQGVSLWRASVGLESLHPVIGARGFMWRSDGRGVRLEDYPRLNDDDDTHEYIRSPFFALHQSDETRLRRRLAADQTEGEFPLLDGFRAEGATDYVAFKTPLGGTGRIGDWDEIYTSWATDRQDGFTDRDLVVLDATLPHLVLALKSAAQHWNTRTLLETYLGRDAGGRILCGEIDRGSLQTLDAVLWSSDLTGFTRIADTIDKEQLISLLNEYADCVAQAVHRHKGHVLKFIGDGVLAAFDAGECRCAISQAIKAAEDALRSTSQLHRTRQAAGLSAPSLRIALHRGEVLYGNIGSEDRLDFTVVGPAVNEVSRIVDMCRSLDQPLILSSAFASAAQHGSDRLVSLGRYALRGVRQPQELFTLEPGSEAVEKEAAMASANATEAPAA